MRGPYQQLRLSARETSLRYIRSLLDCISQNGYWRIFCEDLRCISCRTLTGLFIWALSMAPGPHLARSLEPGGLLSWMPSAAARLSVSRLVAPMRPCGPAGHNPTHPELRSTSVSGASRMSWSRAELESR